MTLESKVTLPISATFWVRDGKAARDRGDEEAMQACVRKVQESGMSEAQKDLAIDKILTAPYNPQPGKVRSGAVLGKTYTATKVSPAEQLLHVVTDALAKGIYTEEEAEPLFAQVEALKKAEAERAKEAAKAKVADQIAAILAAAAKA